ncbi:MULTISPECIES: retron system putative HNH endonuclease [Nostocales]|uniref:TIGR02646 family protein n=3 Tax=Nostocales TaxID=1161 RepID=A0A0C1R0J1_9CYAN|nr:retron system putative HNH endonuclease [Tolypothrix bouteillei]KAF3884867.1 TIGR02646 family protein [Tolypothrix bouteillei VB521301]
MKHIQKSREPDSLTKWKQKLGSRIPDWKSFSKGVKDDVYFSLLQEQGYICCYCGRPISRKQCHIEHYRPKSVYKHLTFEYTNLIASCQGEDEDRPRVPVHCGHKKQAWFDEELMISPLDPNCPDYFKYSGFGEILPTDDPQKQTSAKTTIQKLALDINKLRKLRRAAIDAALQATDGLTGEEIQLLVQAYDRQDSSGRFTPFSAAITYILKQYF